jgi:hypothetical protein
MKTERNRKMFPLARHKAGLFTAVFVLAGAALWLAMPASGPLAEATAAFSIDSIIRATPADLPTLSPDTF